MLRVIGKILIFIFSVLFAVLGISEFIYLFVQYIHVFDAVHISLAAIQACLYLGTGITGIILVTKSKRTSFLIYPNLVIFGLGVYYLIIHETSLTPHYYLALGIINVVSVTIFAVSLLWNRRR